MENARFRVSFHEPSNGISSRRSIADIEVSSDDGKTWAVVQTHGQTMTAGSPPVLTVGLIYAAPYCEPKPADDE